jgi:hypothetical protein
MSSERGAQIQELVRKIGDSSYPKVSVEAFDSADGPLAVANIRVRPGSGRIYTLAVESDVTEDQIRRFIDFATSN